MIDKDLKVPAKSGTENRKLIHDWDVFIQYPSFSSSG